MKLMSNLKPLGLLATLVSSSLVLTACSSPSESSKENQSMSDAATMVFTNGAIYTQNNTSQWAEAVAIEGNEIVYVGDNQGVQSYIGDQTVVRDLSGKMMLPGFHDVHIHPIESASENTLFTLDAEEIDAENFINAIADAAQDNPDAEWLIGYGHTIFTLLDATRPPKDIIDEVVSDRPVIIMEQTSHSMWVNSKALELAGFNGESEDPVGGVLGRDEQTGELNGILIDNAGNMVMDIAMQPNPQRQEADYLGLIEYTLPQLAQHGITSISDARSFWQRDDHKTWLRAEQEDTLTARVSVGLWAYPEAQDSSQLAELKSLFRRDADTLLNFDQIKVYSDGILVNGTAAMFEAYDVDLMGLAGNRGLNYFDQTRLANYIEELEAVGYDFHIHAIGDRGIHEALNAVELAGSAQGRHRITHVEIVDPADYSRFAELNVTADAQVAGDFTNPHHWDENVELIGHERSDNPVPIRSLVEAGARLTLSSDWNVSPFNPFIGIQNAVTRAPQAITLAEAIKSYTINGAYVMRQEHKVGSIEVGKLADLIVVDKNLFEIQPTEINKTKVELTLVDGEIVYKR